MVTLIFNSQKKENEFPCYCDTNCVNMGDCCQDYKAFCEEGSMVHGPWSSEKLSLRFLEMSTTFFMWHKQGRQNRIEMYAKTQNWVSRSTFQAVPNHSEQVLVQSDWNWRWTEIGNVSKTQLALWVAEAVKRLGGSKRRQRKIGFFFFGRAGHLGSMQLHPFYPICLERWEATATLSILKDAFNAQ